MRPAKEREVRVAASILAADFSRLGEELRAAESGGVDWIHLDVMDGRFVPNLSFGPPVIRALRGRSSKLFDVHLMVEDADALISACVEAGCGAVTVQVEAVAHLHRTVRRIRELGAMAGAALNPATPLVVLEEIISELDLVLIMTVNPGFGGQAFIPSMLDKVRRCREMLDRARASALLSVDGGITLETAHQAIRAGADVLVVGTALFGHPGGAAAGARSFRAAAIPATAGQV